LRCDELGKSPAAKADFVGWRVFAGLKVQLPLLKQGASTFAEATADRPSKLLSADGVVGGSGRARELKRGRRGEACSGAMKRVDSSLFDLILSRRIQWAVA